MTAGQLFINQAAITGTKNNGQFRPFLQKIQGQIDAGHAGHGLVGDHRIKGIGCFLKKRQGVPAIGLHGDLVTEALKHGPLHLHQHFLIVNKEDPLLPGKISGHLNGYWLFIADNRREVDLESRPFTDLAGATNKTSGLCNDAVDNGKAKPGPSATSLVVK